MSFTDPLIVCIIRLSLRPSLSDHYRVIPKTRLVKFKGMEKKMFNSHLKECEFRFNNRDEDMYQNLLKIFRDEPLKLSRLNNFSFN